jgi:hypothetical protein
MILDKLSLEEIVTWDKNIYPQILPDMIRRYGEGPFPVVGLRLLPRSVMEVQSEKPANFMVTIELANGDRQEFAGEWFERV